MKKTVENRNAIIVAFFISIPFFEFLQLQRKNCPPEQTRELTVIFQAISKVTGPLKQPHFLYFFLLKHE